MVIAVPTDIANTASAPCQVSSMTEARISTSTAPLHGRGPPAASRIDLGHAGQMTAAAALAALMTDVMQLSDIAPPLVNAIGQLTRIG